MANRVFAAAAASVEAGLAQLMERTKFWMVWNPQGRAPTHKHPSPDQALTEAERLARLNPGQKFYVLEALEMRSVESMQRVTLVGPDDEVPF